MSASPQTIELFRPVGQAELELIRASDFSAFPPRLPHQPIFYPVTTFDYAERIARDWNTKDAASGFVGYVTRFHVRMDFLSRYQIQTVGGRVNQEYWIPAEELEEFNRNIVGPIEVIAEYR
jgi:hypothetical protein